MTTGDYLILEEYCKSKDTNGKIDAKELLAYCREYLIDRTQIPYDYKEYIQWLGIESEKERQINRWATDELANRAEYMMSGGEHEQD